MFDELQFVAAFEFQKLLGPDKRGRARLNSCEIRYCRLPPSGLFLC